MEETIINKVINEGFTISETQKLKKIPMTKWEEQSTSDEDEIIQILSRENVNYAILCGKPSNITVLDVKERTGGHAELNKLIKKFGDEIVDTFIVNTSGGFHIYYRYGC